MKREFHVKTPMGDLHIYAKHENSDIMADYPGVYVELLRDDPVIAHHHCESADTEREENRDAQ